MLMRLIDRIALMGCLEESYKETRLVLYLNSTSLYGSRALSVRSRVLKLAPYHKTRDLPYNSFRVRKRNLLPFTNLSTACTDSRDISSTDFEAFLPIRCAKSHANKVADVQRARYTLPTIQSLNAGTRLRSKRLASHKNGSRPRSYVPNIKVPNFAPRKNPHPPTSEYSEDEVLPAVLARRLRHLQ